MDASDEKSTDFEILVSMVQGVKMDLISNRTSNISHLAMNGLLERQRAIGANIANVETPGYQRKEVVFENQLSEIIEKEDLKVAINKR